MRLHFYCWLLLFAHRKITAIQAPHVWWLDTQTGQLAFDQEAIDNTRCLANKLEGKPC